MSEPPTIGARVHFASGGECLAAVITSIDWTWPAEAGAEPLTADPPLQALIVLPPMQPPFWIVALYDALGGPNTWHWPETAEPRVEE